MFAWKPQNGKKHTSFLWVFFSFVAALLGGFIIGLGSLYLACGSYADEMFASYFENPYILFLNLCVPLLLSAFFFLLTNRAVWSFLLTGVLVMIPSLIHYYKIAFRGDCLIAEDFSLIVESGRKCWRVNPLFWDARIELCAAVAALCVVLLACFARGRFRRAWPRLLSALVLALAAFFRLLLCMKATGFTTRKPPTIRSSTHIPKRSSIFPKDLCTRFCIRSNPPFIPHPTVTDELRLLRRSKAYTDS